MIQLKEEKLYCYREKKFILSDINKKENTCVILYENETPKNQSYDMIRDAINKSIKLKLPGYEMNLNTKGADWYSVIQYIQKRFRNPDDLVQEIISELRKRYYNDRTLPEEWINDIDLIERTREQLQAGLSKNYWIFMLPNKVKGSLMEKLYNSFMETQGKNISRNEKQDYDSIVDGRKKEIKMSTISNGKLNFFNIRQLQEWDDFVGIVVLPNNIYIYEMEDKIKFMDFIKNNPDCQNWSGGEEKKKRLNYDISKNDYFHFKCNLEILENNFNKIYS